MPESRPSNKTPFTSSPKLLKEGTGIVKSSVNQDIDQKREKGGITEEAVSTVEKHTAAGTAMVTDAARKAVRQQVKHIKQESGKKADAAGTPPEEKPPDPQGEPGTKADGTHVQKNESAGRDIPRRPTHTTPMVKDVQLEESPPYWTAVRKKLSAQEQLHGNRRTGSVPKKGDTGAQQDPRIAAKAKVREQAIRARSQRLPNIFQYARQEDETQEHSKAIAKTELKKKTVQTNRKGGVSTLPNESLKTDPIEQPPSLLSTLAPEQRRDMVQGRPQIKTPKATQGASYVPRSSYTTRGRLINVAAPNRPVASASAAAAKQSKKKAAKKAIKQARKANKAKKTTELAIKISVRVARAVAHAVAAAVGAIVGILGGGVLLAILLIVAIVAAIVSSPFGILFSNQSPEPGTIPVSMAVGQLNTEFSNYLDELQSDGYDAVYIHGEVADWVEVLAVFAVKTALADEASAADVVTIDEERVERLGAVFWAMNPVQTTVEQIHHSGSDEDDPGWTEVILHIYIESKTAEDMKTVYGFDRQAAEALDELLLERALLEELIRTVIISDQNAQEILERLPDDLSPERRAAVSKALELVGKVSYFWGGKSYVIGWDDRWGRLMQVTSPGSSSTGKWIPFGLDCTGYLDWTFRNAGLPSAGHWYIGTNCAETTWDKAEPGDIAFWPDDSHVGLVVGRDENGHVLVVHCSYGLNTIAISDRAIGFTKVGKPELYGE